MDWQLEPLNRVPQRNDNDNDDRGNAAPNRPASDHSNRDVEYGAPHEIHAREARASTAGAALINRVVTGTDSPTPDPRPPTLGFPRF
jgi:hypothetical protein